MNNQIIKRSPSNIAIVKYWGKHGTQLPNNPSISFTLSNCFTETKITYSENESMSLEFYFEGKENPAFKAKIEKYLNENRRYFSFLNNLDLKIESYNSFPHSSGIASSASSMSALIMCLLEIKYKDAICKGEQEAIVPRDLWDRVKEIQRSIDPQSDHSRRQETIAPLKSILRCGHCGGAMMPTYSNKGGRRYYYYLCSKDSKRAISECPVKQIPSGDIEALVRKQLQKMLSDISLVMRFAEQSGMSPVEVVECFREEFWNEISPGEYNRLLILLVEKAIVWEDRLELELKTCGVKSLLEEFKNE